MYTSLSMCQIHLFFFYFSDSMHSGFLSRFSMRKVYTILYYIIYNIKREFTERILVFLKDTCDRIVVDIYLLQPSWIDAVKVLKELL